MVTIEKRHTKVSYLAGGDAVYPAIFFMNWVVFENKVATPVIEFTRTLVELGLIEQAKADSYNRADDDSVYLESFVRKHEQIFRLKHPELFS